MDIEIFCSRPDSVGEWIGGGVEEEEENQDDFKIFG